MSIRASAAACDISPDTPIPLAGFTGGQRISEKIGHPLYASAVHIRGGAGGCIIISLDLFSLDPMTSSIIRQRVSSATGTRPENVFVSVTGCTASPYTEDALYMKNDSSFASPNSDYVELVIDKSVKAASEAAVSSRPASMAVVNFNRPGTGALIIKGENGRVIAAVVVKDDVPDYLGHNNTNISADFIATLRENLTRRFGGDPVIAFIPAPCGDQLMEERPDYGSNSADAAGKKLTDDIISRIKTLKSTDFSSDCPVNGSIVEMYNLPRRDLPQIAEASALLNNAGKAAMMVDPHQDPSQRKLARWALIEANRTMSMVLAFKEGSLETALQAYDPTLIQSISIGPIRIIGVPCLMLRHTAQEIISQTAPEVWLAQGVNGTLMGSILSSGGAADDFRGRLLSPVFERSVADKLILSITQASSAA